MLAAGSRLKSSGGEFQVPVECLAFRAKCQRRHGLYGPSQYFALLRLKIQEVKAM